MEKSDFNADVFGSKEMLQPLTKSLNMVPDRTSPIKW